MRMKSRIKEIIQAVALKRNKKDLVPVSQIVDNNSLLSNKIALIIGGTGGIGSSIAKSFINSGCKVILAGTNEEKLREVSKALGQNNAKTLVLNLQDAGTFEDKIGCAAKLFGKIDILVNAAGVHSTNSDFWEMTENEYDRIMSINLRGLYFLNRAIAKYMIDQKIKGHILNVASSVMHEPAWSPYRLSKLGIEGYTQGLAMILQPYGIVVNAIAPGIVATKLIGYQAGKAVNTQDNMVGRYIMPDEIAEYAKLMVSDLGNMIIGDTLFISGGRGTIDIR